MKKLTLLILALALAACSKPSIGAGTKAQYDAMNIESMKEVLTYISSDEMRGRDTGSDELKKVADFLARELNSYGYKGLGESGSFLQPINMYSRKHKHETLSLQYDGKALKFKSGEDVILYARSKPSLDFNAPLYYVQAGVYTDELKQFDPEKTKGAIVIRRAATDEEVAKSTSDRGLSSKLASDYGALAVINILSEEQQKTFDRYKGAASRSGITIDLEDKSGAQLIVKTSFANQLFAKDGQKLENANSDYQFKSNFGLAIESELLEIIKTQNVVAILDGTDPVLKSEVVAFGAHYDHVGVKGDSEIYNGADDDGSGTTGVLHIAKAMALNPPARSVMIIFHTGEEKGLLGSKYYASNPLVKFSDMVAMFNLDMIGRSKTARDSVVLDPTVPITEEGEIYLVGADRISKELHMISEDANANLAQNSFGHSNPMKLNYLLNDEDHPARIYFRSDHWNYAKNGVPIIFYFDGIHVDYHKPTDTVEKIDFEKIKQVTQLTFATGYKVAMQPKRLVLNK